MRSGGPAIVSLRRTPWVSSIVADYISNRQNLVVDRRGTNVRRQEFEISLQTPVRISNAVDDL